MDFCSRIDYPDGGLVKLTREMVEHFSSTGGSILGTAAHTDPFHVRIVNADNAVEEVDRSDELLGTFASKVSME